MKDWPRISIVTPSFNQGRYIVGTIESVLTQEYPNIEHIVVDGGSTDGTLDILKRYPHLKVISEPDRGQAEAINKGFRVATGEIWGFLNSDDTLASGTLHRVAKEIDPRGGRHVVMGRCRFIDEHGRYIGVEHPSRFEGHGRVLEVWKGHTIPQPAVFWTPEVWRTAGPIDESVPSAWIDYDLFCRFSGRYRFHFVDHVFATYRLHLDSKTGRCTEVDRLEECIRLSRRYWGSPLSLMFWRLTFSLGLYRIDRVGRARRWLRQAQESWRHRQVLRAVPYAMAGAVFAPEVAFYVAIYPPARERAKGVLKKVLNYLARIEDVPPQTAVYFDQTEAWSDNWAGPRLVVLRETSHGARDVHVHGWADLTYMSKPLVLTLRIDGQDIGHHCITQTGDFVLKTPLTHTLSPGLHEVEVDASTWFIRHQFLRNRDFRPLSWKVGQIGLV